MAEAIAAERWLGDNAHAKRTTKQLLDGLAVLVAAWIGRARPANSENARTTSCRNCVELIHEQESQCPARRGAALGQLKARRRPRARHARQLLNDDDRWLRVQTAEALRTIGADAKPVLPQMLKAVAVKDETDPMQFAAGSLAFALFYPGGAQGPSGILAKSYDGVSKDLLYPAIRSVAANPDSAARGCLRSDLQPAHPR